MTSFDVRAFRNALSHFATGVAIATAKSQGRLLGTTISSFNSVSLSPPLVLFSIARSAVTLSQWRATEHYGVTVLGEHQSELSSRFAQSGVDKFGNLHVESMENGAPLLSDWLAYFACASYAIHDGGDHEIFVGRVVAFRYRTQGAETRPLVFYKGKYCSLRSDGNSPPPPPESDVWLYGW